MTSMHIMIIMYLSFLGPDDDGDVVAAPVNDQLVPVAV